MVDMKEEKLPVTPVDSDKSFHRGEVETIEKVLDVLDSTAEKRVKEGFGKAYDFTIGVLNCFLMAFVFGKYPQHFWILYIVEGLYLLPFKLYLDYHAKPLNEILYHLDYCWMMNTVGVYLCTLLAFSRKVEGEEWHGLGDEARRHAFNALVGVTGVLMGATAALPFVAVFFHSVRSMAGLFIHLFPPLLVYTFLWETDLIREAWPDVFDLSYMDNIKFFPDEGIFFLPGRGLGTIAGNTVAVYMMWWIPYVSWMILFGLKLPRKNCSGKTPRFDTVFHSTVRGGLCITIGKVCWGRPASVSKEQMENDDYEVRDFLVYMGIHFIMANMAIYLIAYPYYRWKVVHQLVLTMLIVLCVQRGAIRYKYYITDMYRRAVRKEFAPIVTEIKAAKEVAVRNRRTSWVNC